MFQPWPRKAVCPPEHSQGWAFVCPLEPGPERVSAKASFARFTEKWYSVRFANKAPLSFLSISQQPENLLVRENVLINSLLKYNSAWWEHFPVPSVTLLLLFCFELQPHKDKSVRRAFHETAGWLQLPSVQGIWGTVQAREASVPTGSISSSMWLWSHSWDASRLRRALLCLSRAPWTEFHLLSEAGLSWKCTANSVLSDQWERVNTIQCDTVHYSACLGGKVVWKRILGLCISVLLYACPGAWYLWPLSRICKIVLREPLM